MEEISLCSQKQKDGEIILKLLFFFSFCGKLLFCRETTIFVLKKQLAILLAGIKAVVSSF
jgi:hypothetical protein